MIIFLLQITMNSVALWTEERFLAQANSELNCDWKIFNINEEPSLTEYIRTELKPGTRVGADPHIVPHFMWLNWEAELERKYIRLIRVDRNLIDMIWADRPAIVSEDIFIHKYYLAGEKWESKIERLRDQLAKKRCDAMIVTSLTEVAYLLNLRGSDLPHIPVFKVNTPEVLLSFLY